MKQTDKSVNQNKKSENDNKDNQNDDIPSFAKSPKGFIIELVKIVLIALVVIIPIRYFLFQPFYVRGASMEPNYYDNEYLIVDEITYRFTDPERGDVVVVKVPEKKSDYLIKRIIGLPGETVEIKDGDIIIHNNENINGFLLSESYLKDGMITSGYKKEEIGEEEYYLMGDNRPVSLDSRSFGPLNGDNIIGRAWLRVWPFDQFSSFSAPEYNLITN
ncbi:MAG: signal peptidase I [Candidatus Kerfeldbacteria bacterium]|jgi:signal peptidase I